MTVPTTQFELSHTQGTDSCPDPFSSPLVIQNTGGSNMSYMLTSPGGFIDIDGPDSGTILPGNSVSLPVNFTCMGFSPGDNDTSLNIEARDVPTNTVVGTLQIMFSVDVTVPPPPPPPPGVLAFSGPSSLSKTHTVGSSPCPDPYSPFGITNTGGTPLMWSVASRPPFVSNPSPSSGTLAPGAVQTINTSFTCSGFNMGLNSGEIVIESEDGQTLELNIGVNVQN